MDFRLVAKYKPAGDQPKAIAELVKGLQDGLSRQTLLGVTGSGKTFTMANVILQEQRPTLVIAHNKTLAAQLCQEFREFFPNHAVEYFVSYYDYYQPEAYLPRTDTYIEKDAQINEEIDRLRHAATQALLSRRDVIIVASVSCIYGLGSPVEYAKSGLRLMVQDKISRTELLRRLVEMQFTRTSADLKRGHFRAQGDVIEMMPMNEEVLYRLTLTKGVIDDILLLDPVTRECREVLRSMMLFPAKHFMTAESERERAIKDIEQELKMQLVTFEKEGKLLEYERLSRRTKYDIEMMRNIGFCSGIENYSRHFDGRSKGEAPYTLIDYFPKDFLTIIDESHVTLPQIGGMFAGDQARKNTLVEHGFRLPSARDNRPLQFAEFVKKIGQMVFVSATPGPYEVATSEQTVEQIIRPTGLVDPETIVMPVVAKGDYSGQISDLIVRIEQRVSVNERALVTTLTKKMAEDLTDYLKEKKIKVAYLHSDVETLDRITVLTDLRKGVYDVVVGVNLLREGLDLPEVSLIGILDADKEGFLRSATSLIQTIGRAARNVNGQVILYADVMTGSLKKAIAETDRRRAIQVAYNVAHGITPETITKKISDIRAELMGNGTAETKKILQIEMTASSKELRAVITEKKGEMQDAAANLLFETAGLLRDEIAVLEVELAQKEKTGKKVTRRQ